MAAKSKIFRDFAQARRHAVLVQIVPDAFQDSALVGGEVDIAHTYKCTYFPVGMQASVSDRLGPIEIRVGFVATMQFFDSQIEAVRRFACARADGRLDCQTR